MAQTSVIVSSNAPLETNEVKPGLDALNRVRHSPLQRKKCKELLAALTKSLKVSELKVICFVAACNKNVIKPFPLHLADESFEGLQLLNSINKRILKLDILRYFLENNERYKVEETVIDLLHWLICGLQKKLKLQTLSESLKVQEAVLQLVQGNSEWTMPTVCFKIRYGIQSWEHLQWEETSLNKTTKFAFLRTEMNQLHSLIHLGVGSFVNSFGDVGSGVLLTNNLDFCLDATVPAWVWGKNSIGLLMKCVALVEFIDEQATAMNSEDEKSTFYLVNSAAAVRPRFILLYKKDPPISVQPPDVTLIEENQAYKALDQLLRHLPCAVAYVGLMYFLIRETKGWASWGVNGARSTISALVNRLSSTTQTM